MSNGETPKKIPTFLSFSYTFSATKQGITDKIFLKKCVTPLIFFNWRSGWRWRRVHGTLMIMDFNGPQGVKAQRKITQQITTHTNPKKTKKLVRVSHWKPKAESFITKSLKTQRIPPMWKKKKQSHPKP